MFDVSKSARADAARARLEVRFRIGTEEQNKLIQQVANLHIRDKLIPPKRLSCDCPTKGGPRLLFMNGEKPARHAIHPHALGQMCSVVGIPKTYVNRLINGEDWERGLFGCNMHELFVNGKYTGRGKTDTKFLCRFVEEELRGFLSRNFNRHLASLPLLRGFVMACEGVGARPIEASTSSVRFSLKCFLPHVFEPVTGEFVAFGVMWSNSDFGAGRLKVSTSIMRISSGTLSVLEDTMSRVHIGSVIQDSDLEVSEETAIKEVEAQVSAIQDVVKSQLSADTVNKLLTALARASEEQISWHKLKSELGRLQKSDIEDIEKMLRTGIDDIIDLPPPGMDEGGSPIATRWWASNVLGWLASREQDQEKKADLQHLAGDVLKISK